MASKLTVRCDWIPSKKHFQGNFPWYCSSQRYPRCGTKQTNVHSTKSTKKKELGYYVEDVVMSRIPKLVLCRKFLFQKVQLKKQKSRMVFIWGLAHVEYCAY